MSTSRQSNKRSGRLVKRLGIVACTFVAIVVLVGVLGFSIQGQSPQVKADIQAQTNQAATATATATATAMDSQSASQGESQLTTVQPTNGAEASIASVNEPIAAANGGAVDQVAIDPATFKELLSKLPDKIELDTTADVTPEQAEHEENIVLMEVDPAISPEDLNALLGKLDFVTTKDVSNQDLSIGLVELALAPGTDVARAAYTLEETGLVNNAQPNYVYHLFDDDLAAATIQSANVNDPEVNNQWALEKVQAQEAWEVAKTEQAVTVAVLDDGCMVDHEDLAANIVATYNAVDHSSDVSHIQGLYTDKYHGTHVAGIVSAVSNNGKGVSGVSYNAGLLPIQVFAKVWDEDYSRYDETASTLALVTAYEYVISNAAEKHIKVVNLSLGAKWNSLSSTDNGQNDKAVINRMENAYSKGIVTVCAAGNSASGATPPYKCFPVDFSDNIVGVINLEQDTSAGSDHGVRVASSSNYNESGQTTKDISAPGSLVLSTFGPSTSSYKTDTGTSMASPLVAGIIALEFAVDPNLTAAGAIEALHDGATDLENAGWDEHTGYGMANAYGALKATEASLVGDAAVPKGSSIQLSPTKYNSATWSWVSSDESVATVDENGIVTGIETGTATITATFGTLRAEKEVTVYTASISGPSIMLKGSTAQFTRTSTLLGSWTWKSSDTRVAVIENRNGSMIVTGVGEGTATITATNATYDVSVSADLTVYDAKIVNSQGVSSGIGVLVDGTDTLTVQGGPPNTTWTWRSSNSNICAVDETSGVITGISTGRFTSATTNITAIATIGDYVYTVSTRVSVGTNQLSDETTVVTFSEDSFTYDPSISEYKPKSMTVTCGDNTLSSRYYSVAYENNKSVGTATVTISGKNGYVGSVVKTLTITPASIGEFATIGDISELTYTGSAQRPTPSVSVTIVSTIGPFQFSTPCALEDGTDYALSYESNVNAGTATLTVTGKGNYTGTMSKQFTISRASISNASFASIASQTYTGAAIKPAPELAFSGKWLTSGTDYTLSYANNVSVGTATVTVKGKGNFTGETSATFSIAKASLSSASISGIESQTYTGSALTPVPTVTWNGGTLREGADYSLSYKNNVNAGTATVVIAGKGSFTGSRNIGFTIARRNISSATLSAMSSRTYNGKAQTPSPEVHLGSTALVKDADYVLSYKNNTNAGTAVVIATGKGNYSGAVAAAFRITKAANTMKVAALTKSVKYSNVKKRAQVVSGAVRFTVRAQGAVTYAKASGSSSRLSIAKNSGKITVKKGTKKGTYKIKVKVTASGNANYASRSRTVTVKVRVK